MYDYLIVGQGLAGTLLGYRLETAGQSVVYLDHPEQTAATEVAAGIINPITGRRFVKSWRIDELLPVARELYQELEQLLNDRFYFELPLARTLFNRGDRNHWEVRSGEAGYATYMDDHPDLGRYADLTHPAFAYGGVRRAGRVEIGRLVRAYRQRLDNRFHPLGFDYQQLRFGEERFQYGDIRARRIVFCEGWRGRDNPWFGYLPFGGAKGEVLNVRLPGPIAEGMLKQHVFLVPQSDGTYWVGATNENRFTSDAPTPENAAYLAGRLQDLLTIPFEQVDHRAAVRPTVKDRRPFLGEHPEHPGLFIFNGLGTKGASLGPLMSQWMTEFLLGGQSIPGEVDIERFG